MEILRVLERLDERDGCPDVIRLHPKLGVPFPLHNLEDVRVVCPEHKLIRTEFGLVFAGDSLRVAIVVGVHE